MRTAEDVRRERDIDCAMETASNLRLDASRLKKTIFDSLAKEYLRQAKAAEKWATKR